METIVVAAEIGQVQLTTMAAQKNENGTLTLLAQEITTMPKGVLRNGQVAKSEALANEVNSSLKKLGNRLKTTQNITNYYVGLNCRSIRTSHVIVSRTLDGTVSIDDTLLEQMRQEAKSQTPDFQSLLSETYVLDGETFQTVLGRTGYNLSVTFALACVNQSCVESLKSALSHVTNYTLSSYFLAPQVSAEVLTTSVERESGCVVVDLGMGCTSVAVYKQGKLVHTSVIPLGNIHITNDLMSLGLKENEAESLKGLYGEKYGQDVKTEALRFAGDNSGEALVLKTSQIIEVCTKRLSEILAYVMQNVRSAAALEELGAGIILTGGLSRINNIDKIVSEIASINAHVGSYVSCIAPNSEASCANYSAQLIGLLNKATDNCVSIVEEAPAKPKKKAKKSPTEWLSSLFDEK